MRNQLTVVLTLICAVAEARGEVVKSLRLVLPPQCGPVVENIGRMFIRHVESRCDVKVVVQGEAPLIVELAVEPGIGAEGFKIADAGQAGVRIIGNDARGLLYGVGKFLHTSTYGSQGFAPGAWRGVSVPKMPVRGIYLATHFHNYLQVAPAVEMTRYIEDLSLWGVNNYLVWFGMEEFTGMNDPKARALIDRLRISLKAARDLGLNVSLGCIANDGWKNSPVELRADSSTVDHKGYRADRGPRISNMGNELCPSKPGVPEMELGYCREKLGAFKDIGVDFWFVAPYDNGGCTCPKCAPWGANGFLRMAELLAKAYRREYPQGKVVLGTWCFDLWGIGEWDGMAAKFKANKPDWVDYIMADTDCGQPYPRYPLEKGVPGGLPLLNFPDACMYGQYPWGGYGANPYPALLQRRWNETRQKLSGGFVYSEGIYDDLNKVICAQLYWNPEQPALETVRQYAAYEASPAVADDVTSVIQMFEKNHFRDQVGESAVTACRMIEQADAKLTPQARRSWRWRLFCIRAAIDQEIYRNSQGWGRAGVFRQAYEELRRISCPAEDANPMLRPVLIAAVNAEGPDLAAGYAEAVAASKPMAWWRMSRFHDRSIADATGNKNAAICEKGVVLSPPNAPPPDADKKPGGRAACLSGGRIRAAITGLADAYSVEFWFYNTMPNTARPVTGYLFSRGREGPEGTPGDDLGISGTSAPSIVPPGRLFFYNGDAAKLAVGKTELAPETWNHVVLVRNGPHIAVYLNGNPAPEVSGEMEKGYPDGVTQLFVGGRNDNFANFQGRIAEISVYDRALTGEEAAQHYPSKILRCAQNDMAGISE
jgi:hypothetical protein